MNNTGLSFLRNLKKDGDFLKKSTKNEYFEGHKS